ncbi:MAG: hypothetical protein C7B44_13875 [Sulfobacillus thermosulfidooxidans]|uniref:Uncharacterized protein n=1 Tax=Sulfobacillus thermotolerans TaxID=338644 RepID=A0ABM6RRS6_9FIRM|nr:hypothetical protein [Sulfobacillus sp. hq2]AUW94161.1 hypothetical protein BXT84_09515 [Sulfobacillus thermotolerans]POB09572.1 hypothetical protein CO251_15275 [Sulfobacillus sp. hq2]PSR34579.1 MAG: hypothetical protein C7B44_13875 [Sulfobacillus thermosulfidooxidans]
MLRHGWRVGGLLIIGSLTAGCGVAHTATATPQSPTAVSGSVVTAKSVTKSPAVHISVVQNHGQLAVKVATSSKASTATVEQLQKSVAQLNQLLQELQNP